MLRSVVFTRFTDPDGVERRYDLPEIATRFAPPVLAILLNERDDLYVHAAIGSAGHVQSTEFRWGDPNGVDTTQAVYRSVKRETEHAFRSALRLRPFVHTHNRGGVFRPDTLVLRIGFIRPPARRSHSSAL